MYGRLIAAILALSVVALANAEGTKFVLPEELLSHPPYPVVSPTAYVLIEIWGRVRDITLDAHFLAESPERNRNMCEAVRKDLAALAAAKAERQGTELTTYHLCLPLVDAVRQGYIQKP